MAITKQPTNDPTTPNSVSAESANSPAVPNNVSAVTAAGFPRSIEPRVNLDFGDDLYEINGVAKAIDDVVTYTRNSSATYIERYVDQFGKYNYRLTEDYVGNVENLVTYSEQFDNAAWSKSGVSVLPNKTQNPITGERNADSVIADTSNGAHQFFQVVDVSESATGTISFYAKANGYDWVRTSITDNAGSLISGYFNLQSGVIGTVSSGAEAGIKYISDGWYLCSLTLDYSTGGTANTTRIAPANQDNVSLFTGDGSSGIYIWGAQVTESAKPLPYVKTISSPVTETFSESPRLEYDPATGEALGYLAEGSSTNLVTYSEQFDNAAWSKTLVTVTPNDAIAPDGTKSADKLIESSSSGAHTIGSSSTSITSGNNYTLVVFAKAAENSFIQIVPSSTVFGATSHANFDLVNGLLGTVNTGEATIKNCGNGWYKCSYSLTASASSSTGPLNIGLITSATANRTESYVGDGSSGVYIWGAQVEEQPFATSYIRTEGSTVSRSADVMYTGSAILPDPNMGQTYFAEFSTTSDTRVSGAKVYRLGSSELLLVQFSATNNLESYISGYNGILALEAEVEAGQTYKIASVYTNSALNGYFEGSLTLTDTTVTGDKFSKSGNNFHIGSENGAGEFLQGHVKQLTIYDVALTAQEVALL